MRPRLDTVFLKRALWSEVRRISPALLLSVFALSSCHEAIDERNLNDKLIRKQIAGWFSDPDAAPYFLGKLEPSKLVDLVEVRIKNKSEGENDALVSCDLVFTLKSDYKGDEKTPRELSCLHVGFENSSGKKGESKTLSHTFSFIKQNGSWRLDRYREIPGNLKCSIYTTVITWEYDSAPEGQLVRFACVNKSGASVPIDLASNAMRNGEIETQAFGTVQMKIFHSGLGGVDYFSGKQRIKAAYGSTDGFDVSGGNYYMNETQIKKISKQLGFLE